MVPATSAANHHLSRQHRIPTDADAQIEAAVFIPFIFVPSLMITPAPRKPMPETICAATRVTSEFPSPDRYENEVNANEPTHTITFVSIPVLCFVSWRSAPISIPSPTAIRSLITNPHAVVIAGIFICSFKSSKRDTYKTVFHSVSPVTLCYNTK